jgi:hypothetical protein
VVGAAGAGTVTVWVVGGLVTVFAGSCTVVVCAGFGACTVTEFVVEVEFCLITVELDLLFAAMMPPTTPITTTARITGHSQAPPFFGGGSCCSGYCREGGPASG